MEKVDFLLVGQGIAGTVLGLELMQAGYQIRIINEEKPNISSLKAGGLYNPITGRKMVKTWLADELFSGLEDYYQGLEKRLSSRFIYPMPIYRLFFNYEEQNDWAAKASDPAYAPFIRELKNKSFALSGLKDDFGGLLLNQCGYVNLPDFLFSARKYFIDKGVYNAEVFQYEQMIIEGEAVRYKNIEAKKLISCDGPEVNKNPYWNYLPFHPVKGETLEIETDLPDDMIVNRGVFILPKNGRFTVGSTYDHKILDYEPSEEGIKSLMERLKKIYQGDFKFISASAGVRPATFDRRPFVGFHPEYKELVIFNGFGTKGVSLVPYFASQLVNYLKGSGKLMAEVDVSRVIK